MADQNSPQGRRPHFHRGRRGSDRRGGDRRGPQHPPEPQQHGTRDHVDVEQIMRDIRARISQRHGIELSNQQIQELAARRLEAILEPRNVRPQLLEQLRRSAAEPIEAPPAGGDGGYTFEDTTLYESHRGLLRFIRRLLNPILKLFFNPNPLVHALNTQTKLNAQAAARETARDRTQAEWNALHYEILQRLVAEVSRVSLEMQNLSMRVESLGAKVDFNERRVRGFEQSFHQARPQAPRPVEAAPAHVGGGAAPSAGEGAPVTEGGEGRRRRRRRRGRRGGSVGPEGAAASQEAAAAAEGDEFENGDEDASDMESAALVAAEAETVVSHEPAIAMSPLQPSEPRATTESYAAPEAPPAPAPESLGAPAPEPAAATAPELPTQPAPPKDEPLPPAPVDHADPGPTDR